MTGSESSPFNQAHRIWGTDPRAPWESKMMDRLVRFVLRDDRGEVTYVMGAWGVASGAEVHSDIRCGRWRYLLASDDGTLLEVQERSEGDGPSLVAIDPAGHRDVMAGFPSAAGGRAS